MSDENKPKIGTIGWTELITRDKPASVDFYTQLFGWTTESMEMPGGDSYTMFKMGEEMVGGCVTPPADAQEAPCMWMSYVSVDDLDAAVAKAKDLGAKICKERIDIPMGSFAIISDPQGATFAFWQNADTACPE
jgi:uncharacterized protein